jgi:hypothetical protein
MSTPSSRRCSGAMFDKASELIFLYPEEDANFWVSQTGIMYLTLGAVTYNIDLDGGYVARRTSDGEAIPS